MNGHLHDIDIIDPSWCPTHAPARRCDRTVGGTAGRQQLHLLRPIPPNNAPPADITGATLCRSEANHGTAFGAGNGTNGHLDTDSNCGIATSVQAGAQAEAYPAGGIIRATAYRSAPDR